MLHDQWTAVDDYLAGLLVPSDPALDAALQAAVAAGMPSAHVAPNQGKLLYLLARTRGARAILELGTLAGYSTIWLGRALPPGGRLLTLEINPDYAALARANIERAGLAGVVELRLGPASQTMAALVEQGAEPFDLVFIDADKASTPEYLELALRLTRPGSLLIIDNVVRDGAVIDSASSDPSVQGVRRALAALAQHPRIDATAIQTVGAKGYDGLVLALVREG